MSGAIVGAGAGVLPPISIPGMSGAIVAAGAGVLPPISIPGMSIGMSAGFAGAGVLTDPTLTGAAAGGVEAEAPWCEASIIDPTTAIPATETPTDPTWIRRRHPNASRAGRPWPGDVSIAGGSMRQPSLG
ncbi:MAG TPA: hypothetical protein VF391_04785 [Dermatophilaceae bacterium]